MKFLILVIALILLKIDFNLFIKQPDPKHLLSVLPFMNIIFEIIRRIKY